MCKGEFKIYPSCDVVHQAHGNSWAVSKSKNWQKGSSRSWRRIRAFVLARDSYRCQIRGPGCLVWAPLRPHGGIPAGHAHHTRSRSEVGDDPRFIVAACRTCNIGRGDPSEHDPVPVIELEDFKRPKVKRDE